MTLRIAIASVTQDDIVQGEARNCYDCPVQRAISRKLKPGYSVQLGGVVARYWRHYPDGDLVLSFDGVVDSVMNPVEVRNWIQEYDASYHPRLHPMQPFKFLFWAPAEVLL